MATGIEPRPQRRGVLIYTDRSCRAAAPAALGSVVSCVEAAASANPPDHDTIVAALIETGIFEAAVADALCPSRESGIPVLKTLRRASESLGRALAQSCTGLRGCARASIVDAARVLAGVEASRLPSELQLRTPEGYAFYALYPDSYVDAATEWARTHPSDHVVCLGLRGIGTSLSAAVHGALVERGIRSTTWTVRPHGHPFDRHIDIDPELLREWDAVRATFLLIDEGPGLSGSSLAGTARCLTDHGVAPERVVFVAAWHPNPAQLNSPTARDAWRRHEVVTAGFDRVRDRVLPDGVGSIEWSAGRWREYLIEVRHWPPVHPQHERVKMVLPDGRLTRFAGLGSYGRAALQRAERLAGAGWSAPPESLRHGFLTFQVAPGTPVTPDDVDRTLVARAADYLAWLRRHEATSTRASVDRLVNVLEVNVGETLGAEYASAAAGIADKARIFDEPAVALDGRMLLHEWIRSGSGVVKVDAIDHHRDHFMPGTADVAWDVAAFIVEAHLDDYWREWFVRRYASASRDDGIGERLPFYTATYLAFRAGYCAMAEQSVSCTAERERFTRARTHYEGLLRQVLRAS